MLETMKGVVLEVVDGMLFLLDAVVGSVCQRCRGRALCSRLLERINDVLRGFCPFAAYGLPYIPLVLNQCF